MPRIRSVKPEFFSSEPVGNCSLSSRLLFVALWCWADDEGRCGYSPRAIRAFAFPFDESIKPADIDNWVTELAIARLLVTYEVEGRKFLQIINFKEHQHPKKPMKSRHPSPPVPHQFPTSSPPVENQFRRDVGVGVGEDVGGEVVTDVTTPDAGAPPELELHTPPRAKRKPKSAPKYPGLAPDLCADLWERWKNGIGRVEFSRFRSAVGPLFGTMESDRLPGAPTNAELSQALREYIAVAPHGRQSPFAMRIEKATECLGAIARIVRQHPNDPLARQERVESLVHGAPSRTPSRLAG